MQNDDILTHPLKVEIDCLRSILDVLDRKATGRHSQILCGETHDDHLTAGFEVAGDHIERASDELMAAIKVLREDTSNTLADVLAFQGST